jgi:hypothetical protein
MTTRASIVVWSAGSGLLLGLFLDLVLVGAWMVGSAVWPSIAPRQLPRWFAAIALFALGVIPLLTGLLGYLEGRLKLD